MAKYKYSVGWYILHLFEKGKCEREGKVIFLLAVSCAQNKTGQECDGPGTTGRSLRVKHSTPVDTTMSCYWYTNKMAAARKAIVAFSSVSKLFVSDSGRKATER